MKQYSIELPNRASEKRYIEWCDERWYSTTISDTPKFTREQADRIVELMKSHYVYKVNLVDSNGNKEEINSIKPNLSPKGFIPQIKANPISGKMVLDIGRIMRERAANIERINRKNNKTE